MSLNTEPMTIEQNAALLDYVLNAITPEKPGSYVISTLDEQQMHDLRATAERLHRMAPHEAEIRKTVAAQVRAEKTKASK